MGIVKWSYSNIRGSTWNNEIKKNIRFRFNIILIFCHTGFFCDEIKQISTG